MNSIDKLRLIMNIATSLQEKYTTSQINVFLSGFGIATTAESIVPSKRVYVEKLLSSVSEEQILSISKELGIISSPSTQGVSKHESIELKERIVSQLSKLEYPIIDLILDEYETRKHSYEDFNDKESYIIWKISELNSLTLYDLFLYLQKRNGKTDTPTFWGENTLRVFISHLSKDKEKASKLSLEFKKHNITAFVAHEDIEPNEKWLEKIEEALISMDALVALVTEGFRDSSWTSQEIGFALGRGIPVVSIKNGMDPFGFFGMKQAVPGNGRKAKEIVDDIIKIFLKIPDFAEKIKNGV